MTCFEKGELKFNINYLNYILGTLKKIAVLLKYSHLATLKNNILKGINGREFL